MPVSHVPGFLSQNLDISPTAERATDMASAAPAILADGFLSSGPTGRHKMTSDNQKAVLTINIFPALSTNPNDDGDKLADNLKYHIEEIVKILLNFERLESA